MSTQQDENPLTPKLNEVRDRLMGDPTREDLQEMQLRLDVMGKYDQQIRLMMEAHHHDHMDDHDHSG
jgi:hypothetical protein